MLRASSKLSLRASAASIPIQAQSVAISSLARSRHASGPTTAPLARVARLSPSVLPSAARNMSVHHGESAIRPEPDQVLQDIADYVHDYKIESDLAWETARLCLIDTIGCGLEGLRFPACRAILGPIVPGTVVPNGAFWC
jgi:2-methylcitrate dehydratase